MVSQATSDAFAPPDKEAERRGEALALAGYLQAHNDHMYGRLFFAMPFVVAIWVFSDPTWALIWLALTYGVELPTYFWRIRAIKQLKLRNEPGTVRWKNETTTMLGTIAWSTAPWLLYLSGTDAGGSLALILLVAIQEVLAWQNAGTLRSAFGPLLVSSISFVAITSSFLFNLIGWPIYLVALTFCANAWYIAFLNLRSTQTLHGMRISRERLIAELQRAKDEAIADKQRAEKATRAKSDFLAVMSHEIRTPMNGVISMAALLENTPLTRKQQRYVEVISQSGRMTVSLLSDILDISKIETGKMTLRPRRFDLQKLCEDLVDTWLARAESDGLRFEVGLAPETPRYVKGDEDRLRQILFNLISNALKFTNEGGVQIYVRPGIEPDKIRFTVSDTGIGIGADHQHSIFDRFSQVDASSTRQRGGTGLGLAIVKELVELMEGSIGFRSDLDEGTTFWTELKLPESEPSSAEGPERFSLDTNVRPLHILLAEDVDLNREVVTSLFEASPHILETVENGQQAVERVARGGIDLVLMDVRMPVMDGLDACRAIRKLPPPVNATPVIALTASALSGDEDGYADAGMDDLLTKPIQIDALNRAINQVAGVVHYVTKIA